MTKDTTSNFQKGQSSQVTKSSPTKPRDNISRRKSYKPEHLKFFLLIFLNDYKYVVNSWAHFGGPNRKYRLE